MNKWAYLLFEEIFRQGDQEAAQGLEVAGLSDRKVANVAQEQPRWIGSFVVPLFESLSSLSPDLR